MFRIRKIHDAVSPANREMVDQIKSQIVNLDDGFYHITLLSKTPESGLLGDNQEIRVYLQKLDETPLLGIRGVPNLC